VSARTDHQGNPDRQREALELLHDGSANQDYREGVLAAARVLQIELFPEAPGQVDKRVRVNLPLVPMSYNAQRYTHWRKVRRMNRPLVESLTLMLRNRGIPQPCAAIRAEAELTFPTLRRRDEGNFRTPLEKALGDVLVKEGFLTDDTPEQFRMGRVTFAPHKGPAATRLTLLLTYHQENQS
jgi:hypothetical protein